MVLLLVEGDFPWRVKDYLARIFRGAEVEFPVPVMVMGGAAVAVFASESQSQEPRPLCSASDSGGLEAGVGLMTVRSEILGTFGHFSMSARCGGGRFEARSFFGGLRPVAAKVADQNLSW